MNLNSIEQKQLAMQEKYKKKWSMNMKIDALINCFIEQSIKSGEIDPIDKIYLTNRLIALLGKEDFIVVQSPEITISRLDTLDQLIEYAVETGLIEDLSSSRDILSAEIMDLITPRPSEVNHQFWETYNESPVKATNEFYEMSQNNNYIKTREIAQNIAFNYDDVDYGEIQITINLSKPEKDPKEIALASKFTKSTSYPANALVAENEGYRGNLSHPGRTNHRLIRMDLQGDQWAFQYSPYAYYKEHSIFLAMEHRPMDVGPQAIRNLLEIIRQLPHYFVGSNAGLPIVGGSILSHDHYQGGRHHFPIQDAEYSYKFEMNGAPKIEAGIVKWPMSVIRLRGKKVEELAEAAATIMEKWEGYSDNSVGIYGETEGIPHNAITPIARMNGDQYELDIVLRNNLTTKDYPDGVFHPHPHVQHIKKENIGLIEVMGLAILPPRLKQELADVEAYLLDENSEIAAIHQEWADQLKKEHANITKENVRAILEAAVGKVFVEVLENAGVFKQTEEGQKAFVKFIEKMLI